MATSESCSVTRLAASWPQSLSAHILVKVSNIRELPKHSYLDEGVQHPRASEHSYLDEDVQHPFAA